MKKPAKYEILKDGCGGYAIYRSVFDDRGFRDRYFLESAMTLWGAKWAVRSHIRRMAQWERERGVHVHTVVAR